MNRKIIISLWLRLHCPFLGIYRCIRYSRNRKVCSRIHFRHHICVSMQKTVLLNWGKLHMICANRRHMLLESFFQGHLKFKAAACHNPAACRFCRIANTSSGERHLINGYLTFLKRAWNVPVSSKCANHHSGARHNCRCQNC